MKTYIGVDLGGTNVRAAIVDEDGKVLIQKKSPSYAQEGKEKVMDTIINLIKSLPDYESCSGIGVGVPGPCDEKTGSMVLATNLPGFEGYSIANKLEETFHMPSFIDNDANVAALAEALVGAGKGKKVVYYVTLSTGIGGGLVINGECISGKHGFTGEIANIIIDRNRSKVNYLAVGAIENEASGTAITRKANEKASKKYKHAGEVFEDAHNGDLIAKEIVDNVARDLAQLFATIACVCDPDIFILGGGMMQSSDLFLPSVIEKFKEISHTQLHDDEFVLASFEEPGVIGAAMLPKSKNC
ncbi:MAG: ROK family protein [Bulleidia sp.]|nr:ROK family protein [Erysipelotrichaceae bacterium]MDY2781405.1 ROK family protein [Bulleidia sp.]